MMIVIFGASTDIGQRLFAELKARGLSARTSFRSDVDLATGHGLAQALDGAETVVSCAHARFTKHLLGALPGSVSKLILTGSAWRYSRVPNARADQVREAERAFIDSGRDGVMLHPAMIYGGTQERNIIRLLATIRKFPIIPAPGGGKQIVQPIYVDDVVRSLVAAIERDWTGPNVVPIGGPKLTWRQMLLHCAASIGRRPVIVSVPMAPLAAGLSILNSAGVSTLGADVIRRFGEDVDISIQDIERYLASIPALFWKSLRRIAGRSSLTSPFSLRRETSTRSYRLGRVLLRD